MGARSAGFEIASRAAAPLRVALVSRVRLNPYVRLLAEGLAQALPGEVEVMQSGTWSVPWLWRERSRLDLCHLHWLELFYSYPSAGLSLRRWASSVGAILLSRALGMPLVATVHNVAAHEGRWPRLDAWTARLLYRQAAALHVHDADTLAEVVRRGADPRRVAVIPHGTYAGVYPDDCTRAQARERLGLGSGDFVYLSLGMIRSYKGLEDLLEAFSALACPEARLVVAGQAHEEGYAARLADLARGDPRVYFRPGHVPDDALQYYFRAADVAVLPYRQTTTSGAAYLAFSFGVPIVAPRLGPFPELVGESRGLVYEPGAKGGLVAALWAARGLDGQAARAACEAFNRGHAWAELARRHAALYRFACASRAGESAAARS